MAWDAVTGVECEPALNGGVTRASRVWYQYGVQYRRVYASAPRTLAWAAWPAWPLARRNRLDGEGAYSNLWKPIFGTAKGLLY